MTEVSEFFAAIVAGDATTVRALIDGNPGLIQEKAADGASASLTALYNGHAPLADELAARAGQLSVFEAAAFDDVDRLSELITLDRSSTESWSADGWQPLHLAAYFGRGESVRVLLDADAPVAEPSRNAMAVHPLHAAASGQHAEIVWLLIASGAPVNETQRHGWTALHSAVHNGDAESVRALLAAGADPSLANDEGVTAWDLATEEPLRALIREASS